jgi:hypothetical protein
LGYRFHIAGGKKPAILKFSGFIRLHAAYTQEEAKRSIPINHHVKTTLDSIIRQLNSAFVFAYAGQTTGPLRRGSTSLKDRL